MKTLRFIIFVVLVFAIVVLGGYGTYRAACSYRDYAMTPPTFSTNQVVTARLDGQRGIIIRPTGGGYYVRFPRSEGGYQDIWMMEGEIIPEVAR